MTNTEKGPIFVSGADGDKGYAIVQSLLNTPTLLHLSPQHVYASVTDPESEEAQKMRSSGATTINLNILKDYVAAVDALRDATKLILLIDPLNKKLTKDKVFCYGKLLVDAAKEADVQQIIFLNPFSKLDPLTPPSSPYTYPGQSSSYRAQFMNVQSYLESVFDKKNITILCYPGILHQHLLVFKDYMQQHHAFPLPNQFLENTVELSSLADIAKATAYIAYSPISRHGGKEYKLTGPQLLTLEEVSANVLRSLGYDGHIDTMGVDGLKEILTESMGSKDHADFLLEIWGLQQHHLAGRRLEVTRDMEALTGQSGKTLGEYFADVNVCDRFLSPTTANTTERIVLS